MTTFPLQCVRQNHLVYTFNLELAFIYEVKIIECIVDDFDKMINNHS